MDYYEQMFNIDRALKYDTLKSVRNYFGKEESEYISLTDFATDAEASVYNMLQTEVGGVWPIIREELNNERL